MIVLYVSPFVTTTLGHTNAAVMQAMIFCQMDLIVRVGKESIPPKPR